ncbi:MMPL family transporter [Actinomyces lilanjuaniae]|uniref:MMPL family transporter n=1 Tax=Actinomyces lilanjuaniae TaxID=2321394 RepID=A0ABM6Z3Y6_9ACTO|nr:MMPL family transporter [Actinomyces lilanjuaniae]AYD89755.1 MMPL family transporter [Actinomyces lilanjuaniae]
MSVGTWCDNAVMLGWLSYRVFKDAWLVVATWLVLSAVLVVAALTGLGGQNLFSRLHSVTADTPGTQSAEGGYVLDSLSGDAVTVTLLVSDVDLSTTQQQEEVAQALSTAHADLGQLVGTHNVLDPFVVPGMLTSDAARSMAADSMDGFVVVVTVNPNGSAVADPEDTRYAQEVAALVDQVSNRLEEVPAELAATAPGARGTVSHDGSVEEAISSEAGRDLLRSGLLLLPVALLVTALAVSRLLQVGACLLATVVSAASTLGAVYGLSLVVEVPYVAAVVFWVLGASLTLGYALLLTSRYQETLGSGTPSASATEPEGPPEDGPAGSAPGDTHTQDPGSGTTPDRPAPVRGTHRYRRDAEAPPAARLLSATMRTAGRTVVFSALAVAVSLCGLYLAAEGTLRASALTGAVVLLVSVSVSLTLVPALLALTGQEVLRPSSRPVSPVLLPIRPTLSSALRRLSGIRRDGRGTTPAGARIRRSSVYPWAVLAGCLLVLTGLAVPLGSLHTLTSTASDQLPVGSDQRAYAAVLEQEYPSTVDQDATLILAGTGESVTEFINDHVASVPGVEAVVSPSTAGDYTVVYLDLTGERWSGTAEEAVTALRALDPPVETWVTGQAASQVDMRGSLLGSAPVVAAAVVLATVVLLLLLTDSLLLPLVAVPVTGLSLSASLGVLTWVVQEGHGRSLLGLAPAGGVGVDTTAVVTAVLLGLGLAMSHEVVLMSRVAQYRSAGTDHRTALHLGLRQSRGPVLAAAVVTVAACTSLLVSRLPLVQETGLALALVVAVDLLLVRLLLLPSVMRILGRWSWWAPRWLRPSGASAAQGRADRQEVDQETEQDPNGEAREPAETSEVPETLETARSAAPDEEVMAAGGMPTGRQPAGEEALPDRTASSVESAESAQSAVESASPTAG